MSHYGDGPKSKTTSIASSRTIQYAQRLASNRTSASSAETTTAHQFRSPPMFPRSSTFRQTTETPDELISPWPRHSKVSTVTTTSSWNFSLTPPASIGATSAPPTHTYLPLPSDAHGIHTANNQMSYNARASIQAPLYYQPSPSCSMISATTQWPHDSVSYIGAPKNQSSTNYYPYYHAPMISPPVLVPLQWGLFAPAPALTVLPLPPPGYSLWVPIFQPPGSTFFKPSDTKPKEAADIEASPVPNDWQYRTTLQREHWVEMLIFQRIPIMPKKYSKWRCGMKDCRWATKGGVWPTLATEYLVHQFEMHECWWSRSDEGRVHINRLKRSLSG